MTRIATIVEERGSPSGYTPRQDDLASTPVERADRVREAIESAGLTLYQVSALTTGQRARAHGQVAHTLYRDIRAGHVPALPQLASLSHLTHRPLAWWLALFGIDLSTLATLQMTMHRERTVVLASRSFDPSAAVPHWERWSAGRDTRRIQRLADVVEGERGATAQGIDSAARRRFLYLSVGAADPWLAAEVARGSIVRVDPRQSVPRRFGRRRAVYAVAHPYGLSCCYVDVMSPSHVAIFGDSTHTAPMICRLGGDAAIRGRVDAELRLLDRPSADVCGRHAPPRRAGPIALPDARRDPFGRFVRRSRGLIGLTFRDAHALTGRVAAHFGDERFRISLGALSNYETLDTLPGSAHALFSLAAVYAMDFWSLLRAGGLRMDRDARIGSGTPDTGTGSLSPWMDEALRRTVELPIFLAPVLRDLLGTSGLDPQSLYLWGSGQRCFDLRLEGAVALAVDRDNRSLGGRSARTSAEAPLFMLRLPNDAYVCCAASLHGASVIVHPSPALGLGPRCFPREHLEVIGRVSSILRRVAR
jgi:hypothetical protein